MSNQRYPEEFKIQAVKQVTEKQLPVSEVAARLGVSVHSLYAWVKRYTKPQEQRVEEDDQSAEVRRLRAELKRVTEERGGRGTGRTLQALKLIQREICVMWKSEFPKIIASI